MFCVHNKHICGILSIYHRKFQNVFKVFWSCGLIKKKKDAILWCFSLCCTKNKTFCVMSQPYHSLNIKARSNFRNGTLTLLTARWRWYSIDRIYKIIFSFSVCKNKQNILKFCCYLFISVQWLFDRLFFFKFIC